MGRRYVLTDDLDGKELPDGTEPVALSLGRTTYNLYLSEANHGKLLEVLDPFIKDAESVATATAAVRTATRRTTGGTDKEKLKAVRAWAQANDIKHNGKALGDRGRIPAEIVKQYEEAN